MANILFVDDDVEMANVVADLLRHESHLVELVHTGLEGREKASSNQFDLLILDWDLPDINGINILRKYRDMGGLAPIMMLTGHVSASDKELGLDTGADDYVTKPFDPIELAARVRALLRRARAQGQASKPLGKGNEHILNKAKLIGTSLAARYEFLEVIGEGGAGIVYKVHHPMLDKFMAVKMLQTANLSHEAQERFKLEAKAICRLEHPNIITVHDFGITENGQLYMVMDFIEGIELRHLLKQRGALPPGFALNLSLQLCDAMAHAHSMHILHRDLKTSNIMLRCFTDREPVPKICDFGLVKMRDFMKGTDAELTRFGQMFGSPPFMSPEQIEGGTIDERSDIYSLACVIYALFTGVPPHLGENVSQIVLKHLHAPVPQLADLRPDLSFPPGLEVILQKALSKKAEHRYRSMSELRDSLASLKQISTNAL